jgi:hypothetical protein
MKLTICLLALAATAAQATGQTAGETTITDCSDRRSLVLERVASIPDRGFRRGAHWAEARDGRGRYYIARSEGVYVFDERGRYITRFGREGGGPGEYIGNLLVIPVRGDTLLIFDAQRLTILSPDYAVVRTEPFRSQFHVAGVPMGTNRVVFPVAASLQDHSPTAFRAHDLNGRPVGKPFAVIKGGGSARESRYNLTSSVAGQVWTWAGNMYLIEQWDTAGRRTRALKRNVPWFREWTQPGPGLAHFSSLSGDRAKYVWTLLAVPKGDLGDMVSAAAVRGETPSLDGEPTDHETVVELIDLERRCVAGSGKLPPFRILRMVSPGTIRVLREAEDGTVFMDFWRLTLSG